MILTPTSWKEIIVRSLESIGDREDPTTWNVKWHCQLLLTSESSDSSTLYGLVIARAESEENAFARVASINERLHAQKKRDFLLSHAQETTVKIV